MLRSDPRFWKGKVRVSATTYGGVQCFTAEWRGRIGGEPYWRMVKEDNRASDPVMFASLDAARQAAIKAYDFDMDVAVHGGKQVWP